MKIQHSLRWNQPREFGVSLRLIRLRSDQAEPLADSMHMSVHRQDRFAARKQQHTRHRLRPHSRNQLAKDYPAAITAYRESLELRRALGRETTDVAIGLNTLAVAEWRSGDLDASERNLREALRIARAVDYREGIATYTGNLAELALDREDWPGAEALAREALPLSEQVGRLELIAAVKLRSDCTAAERRAQRKRKHQPESQSSNQASRSRNSSDLHHSANRILAE